MTSRCDVPECIGLFVCEIDQHLIELDVQRFQSGNAAQMEVKVADEGSGVSMGEVPFLDAVGSDGEAATGGCGWDQSQCG